MIGTGVDMLGDAAMPYLIAAIYIVYLPVFLIGRASRLR